MIKAHGVKVTPAVRERVAGWVDGTLLDLWLRRAAVIGSARELFD